MSFTLQEISSHSGTETPIMSPCKQVTPVRMDIAQVAIRRALNDSGYRELRRIECRMLDGTVALHGTVQSYHLKQLAQEIVRRLDHVNTVRNQLQVKA